MSKAVLFNEAEIAEPADFSAIGAYARADAQTLAGAGIGAPNQWARFSIQQPSATTLLVNPGSLFVDKIVYDSDPITVDLQIFLPLVSSDQKWIALLVRGSAQTLNDNRLVETDVDTGATVLQAVPKTDALGVSITVQDGVPSPTPLKPTVPADQCCLAFVLLTPTGISTIEPGEAWRLKSLYEVTGRVLLLEGDMSDVRQRTATLETDLSNIAGRIKTIPRPELMQQLQTDAAALRRAVNLPAAARAYWYNQGLFTNDWDQANGNWLARIWTGVRFPWATIINNQLAPNTPGDPLLKIVDSLALPAWSEVAILTVDGADGSKDISQLVHTVTTAVQHSEARSAVSYGPTINVCQNQTGFAAVAGAETGQTFTANGQTYVSDGLSNSAAPYAPGLDSPAQWNADPNSAGHQIYAVQELQVDSWTETYWSYVTTTVGVNGSIFGQTFTNGQAIIATSIDLTFTRVGGDGDVHLFVGECDATGQPNLTNVLANSTVAASGLAVGKNKFAFKPVLFEPGKRYWWSTVTVGNHAVATVSANKYAQGSLFWCTDGAWAQGDNQIDFVFTLNGAQFAATRSQVEFTPLSVPGGMSEIKILTAGFTPAGTQLVWEILPTGSTQWSMLVPQGDANPLVGLPALTRVRATFVGTTSLMPGIVLDSNARIWGGRMQGVMTAPSKQQPFGLSTTSITVKTTVDNFDASLNTIANKLLLADGTILTPSATSTVIDPDRSKRRTVTSTFTLGTAQTQAAAMPTMTTSNVVKVPFVQDILMIAN